MLISYLELYFDVLHAATNNGYVDGNDIRIVKLGSIVFFSIYNLTTSSGQHLKIIDHAHIVSLMYKLLTRSRGSDDLSIGFDRDRGRRQRELTNNKNMKEKYHVRIYLKDVFGFAEQQEICTYGLGYNFTLTRNTDNAVLNKGNANNNGKIKINAIEWYVSHYTLSITQQNILMNQNIKKKATELQFPEKSAFMKEVNTQNFRTFEVGTPEVFNIPIWIYVVLQQKDRQHDQNLNNDTFVRLSVKSAQVVFGTES